ncbi:MAG: hypothetical protein ACYTXY_01490 [Nostoc sp.]
MSDKTFDIAYLSDNLLDLLSDIQNNIEITLTRQGVPWAKILPLSQAESTVEKAGLNHGSMVISSEDVLEPRVAGFGKDRLRFLMILMTLINDDSSSKNPSIQRICTRA